MGAVQAERKGELLLRNRQNTLKTATFIFILSQSKGPILFHDNAQRHVLQMTLQKLNELAYETLPYPAYSPDLSSTDYHFFKHLDNFLQTKVFKNQPAIKCK
uniref:Histone-lysine N-methyltransferase SETMAR n=1 Tax=Heterorhabditis bacteriophora TaxID=37862 RepID=A0A1I7X938_HETBA